jgi:thiamine biosynthesis protein ThiS
MNIRLNGKLHELAGPVSILGLLDSLKLQSEVVAVELNEEIVKRDERAGRMLQEGDAVEVIRMIGGG